MAWVVVRHQVKDYPQWKRAFEEHLDVRNEMGLRGGLILCDDTDPKHLTVAMECDDLARARDILTGPEMKQIMADAGVIGEPEIMYLKELETVEDIRAKAA